VLGFLEDFRSRSAVARLTVTVLEDIGDPAERILREGQRCDVVVLGRETHFRFETQDRPDATLAQVIRTSPRPVVVVSRKLPDGGGIMVAYGGGRAAARTLQTFESLGIAAGQDVAVVTVHRDRAEAEAVAALAGDFLTAHGTPHQLFFATSVTRSGAGGVPDSRVHRRLSVVTATGGIPNLVLDGEVR
jgi:hypothetical protein